MPRFPPQGAVEPRMKAEASACYEFKNRSRQRQAVGAPFRTREKAAQGASPRLYFAFSFSRSRRELVPFFSLVGLGFASSTFDPPSGGVSTLSLAPQPARAKYPSKTKTRANRDLRADEVRNRFMSNLIPPAEFDDGQGNSSGIHRVLLSARDDVHARLSHRPADFSRPGRSIAVLPTALIEAPARLTCRH
jgi:hypothetical protein